MVGDTPILRGQLQEQIDRLPPGLRQDISSARLRPLLDGVIQQELLVKEAQRRGLDKDPEYQRIVQQQLIALLLSRAADAERPDTAASSLEAYYEAHTREFAVPARVRLSQIVVPDRALADRLLQQVRALRKDDASGFAALAARHSIHAPTRDRGGDAGLVDRDSVALPPAVREAAFGLEEVDVVSEVVESDHGFHILRVTERVPASVRPFAEVQEQIRQRLLHDRRTRTMEALLTQSRARHKVEVFQ